MVDIPCTRLQGVGPRLAQRLSKLQINNLQDLLFHLPIHYQDRTRITPIKFLRVQDFAVIEGQILETKLQQARRRSFLIYLEDASGVISLRFFHFNSQQMRILKTGVKLRCFSQVRWGPFGLEMVHPEYQLIDPKHPSPMHEYLTPIYPSTEGLSQNLIRKLISQAFSLFERENYLREYLPEKILEMCQFPRLIDAIRYIHYPPADAPLLHLEQGKHFSQQRLIFEELLAHQLSLRRLRNEVRQFYSFPLVAPKELIQRFIINLPFALTAAQQNVINEITKDLSQAKPMLRLVQGDVGSGKTIVAAIAALHAVANGYQVALMAPTELLAEQHTENFNKWLLPFGFQIACLTGSLKSRIKNQILTEVKEGKVQVLIGTHALFQKEVEFAKLALIIVDEQHRFGVAQRLELRNKASCEGYHPHQLSMTATPIPRTLTMIAYADLDCSMIDELPQGRIPVNTVVISNQRRNQLINQIRQICLKGQQIYWICTLIEESEALQCQAAEATYASLTQALPHLRLGLIHGRIKSNEKETLMRAFKEGQIDILVATTVIEVGVDVPNANVMIIENAERLGLSQLHQLRGRVGRGNKESHCILLYQSPLSPVARQRLLLLREENNGFIIAQKDLELRGGGELLGTRQTGIMRFRIANLLRDKELFPKVQEIADLLLQESSESVSALMARWIRNGQNYANV